ncbi:hypothetical protein APB30_04585 [Pseudomonas aeruginosa]|nr:hypothetical protein APB30_04585 [Pseudomonas aeruginosa]
MLAYVLWNEFNAKQVNIAKVLNVSGPTISLWLKEMRYRAEIHSLTQELQEVRMIAQGLQAQGLIEHRQTFDVLD